MQVALITGGSKGLGLALATGLVEDGWSVVIDGRDATVLDDAVRALKARSRGEVVRGIAGDVADPAHRVALLEAITELGRLDLLVNNASTLGPSPQPLLADYPLKEFERVLSVNLVAPLALLQATLPLLRSADATVVNVTSDAGVEGYAGWGGYGSSKAGLEQLSNVLAAEEVDLRVYWFDPGDMRTEMHQAAFPGEDISDRPMPETVVPALLRLISSGPPSGRYRASQLLEVAPMITTLQSPARLSFDLPPHLEAAEPAEARGATRDGVRLMVAERSTGCLTHTTFPTLPAFLEAGDLIVINTSAVVPAAISAWTDDGARLTIHLSTRLDDGRWVVELRHVDGRTTSRWVGPVPRRLHVGVAAAIFLESPYLDSARLWIARLDLPEPVFAWLTAHGQPIRYSYVEHPWPIGAYQNVYAIEPGSAEMPSAGRPFTPEVITRLVAKGVGVSPLVLHTGVASLEATELPYPERLRVPASTASRVNETHRNGGRVIAVGTTVVRGLETAGAADGLVQPFDGWTDLVITPDRGVHIVDGLLTGWHEPEASHLLMLEAVAGRSLLERSYEASLREGYLWHEFGDMHLIVP